MTSRKIALHVVTAPAVSVVLDAPPVLMASEHSVDYLRPLRHHPVARRRGPSSRDPDPLHKLRIA